MIRVIASNADKKGEVFEAFIKKMLNGLGYQNFRTVRKTGRQIDILANDRVTDIPITCECKAYASKLEGDHLSKFRGLYDTEHDKDKSLRGLFFSLSGFTGGFTEYYNEMDVEFKERCKTYSDKDIYQFIKDSKIPVSDEVIIQTIKNKLPYDIRDQYLSISEYGEYWIITFGIGARETHFTILSGKGDEV